MKIIMPHVYKPVDKLICVWTDRNNFQTHYKIFKNFCRDANESSEMNYSYETIQEKWLKPHIDLDTKLRSGAEKKSEFICKIMNNTLLEDLWELQEKENEW